MLKAITNWWRGYSDEDLASARRKLRRADVGAVIYLNPRERCALTDSINKESSS